MAIFVAFAILFTLAVVVRVPLEQLADPTDTTYIPRPEWYFLFLFQTLKLFKGPLEVVGSVVLPGLAVLALIAVPFLDRGRVKRVAERTVAIGAVVLAAIGWASRPRPRLSGRPTRSGRPRPAVREAGRTAPPRKWPAWLLSRRPMFGLPQFSEWRTETGA